MSHVIRPVILAGGSGTRLWPLSRRYYPKQFIQLKEFWGVSLFQQTLKRMSSLWRVEDVLVVTNADYKFHCLTQSEEIGHPLSEDQILIEPVARGTLAAITFAMRHITDATEIALITPSDNLIEDTDLYRETVLGSVERAKRSLITFGVVPSSPHTGYGYISPEKNTDAPYRVEAFREKPDLQTAEKYIRDGYLWNSGSFLFSRPAFESELTKWNPEYVQKWDTWLPIAEIFGSLEDLSIDYGLMELSDNIYVTPLECYWDDLGSFDALSDYIAERQSAPETIEIESRWCLTLCENERKSVALIGVEDLLVIDTPDALLISKKWESQKIKEVVTELKRRGSSLTDYGTTVYRPWGSYTIIDEWEGFKSKRLTVLPGKKLSLQMHHHRSEHWVVVSGTAQVTVGENVILLKKGESTFIPIGTKHRLENPGKTELHLIESQIGDYLEEDDIIRFDDTFRRA